MVTKTTPSISDLQAAYQTVERPQLEVQIARLHRSKIDKQVPIAQQRVVDAHAKWNQLNKAYNDAVLSVDPCNLSQPSHSKADLDAAEQKLKYRREELKILRDGQAQFQEKIDTLLKEITHNILQIRDMAEAIFKAKWSRDAAWKTNSQGEYAWRQAIFLGLLAKLPSDPTAFQALIILLGHTKFSAKVTRGFLNVNVVKRALVWSDESSQMVEPPPIHNRRLFARGENVTVPRDLNPQLAFEALMLGRLELVSA